MNTPFNNQNSPDAGHSVSAGAMTDVLIAPSTSLERPWLYLIGYTHSGGASNWTVDRARPIIDLSDIALVIADIATARPRHVMIGIVSLTLLTGPDVIAHHVPVATGPNVDLAPYRYLTSYYGVGDVDKFGFSQHITDMDAPIASAAVVDHVQKIVGPQLGFDRWARMLGFTLLAGPANS